MKTEYRVVWKRVDCAPKRKRYIRRAAAERFVVLLGAEPWKAFGRDPDEYVCCSGSECGCAGLTVREDSDARRAEYPAIEFVRLETRTVEEWTEVRG